MALTIMPWVFAIMASFVKCCHRQPKNLKKAVNKGNNKETQNDIEPNIIFKWGQSNCGMRYGPISRKAKIPVQNCLKLKLM